MDAVNNPVDDPGLGGLCSSQVGCVGSDARHAGRTPEHRRHITRHNDADEGKSTGLEQGPAVPSDVVASVVSGRSTLLSVWLFALGLRTQPAESGLLAGWNDWLVHVLP